MFPALSTNLYGLWHLKIIITLTHSPLDGGHVFVLYLPDPIDCLPSRPLIPPTLRCLAVPPLALPRTCFWYLFSGFFPAGEMLAVAEPILTRNVHPTQVRKHLAYPHGKIRYATVPVLVLLI